MWGGVFAGRKCAVGIGITAASDYFYRVLVRACLFR